MIQFRLLTGHDCLGENLHRIGIFDKPNCILCNLDEPMNRAHFHRCLIVHDYSKSALYWRARELLRPLLQSFSVIPAACCLCSMYSIVHRCIFYCMYIFCICTFSSYCFAIGFVLCTVVSTIFVVWGLSTQILYLSPL